MTTSHTGCSILYTTVLLTLLLPTFCGVINVDPQVSTTTVKVVRGAATLPSSTLAVNPPELAPQSTPQDQASRTTEQPGLLKGAKPKLNPDTAITYKGNIEITIPGQESNFTQYFISFVNYSTGCGHAACYYGWVDNYTTTGEAVVQGYPNGNTEATPVFQFKTNSKTDYIIVRDPLLSEPFANIIEIGCELLEPTIKGVSTFSDQPSALGSTDRFFTFLNEGPQYQYTFTPAPDQTVADPWGRPSAVRKPTDLRVATVEKTLSLDSIETTQSDLTEKITVDKDYNVVNREKVVTLNIPSDSFTEDSSEHQLTFLSNIKVEFNKAGDKPTNMANIKKIVESYKKIEDKQQIFTFTAATIEAKRNDKQKIEFYNEDFNIEKANLIPSYPRITGRSAELLSALSVCSKSSKALLTAEKEIYSYTKQLFSKKVFGRQFSVTINITAILLDNKNVRFRGVLIYDLFDNQQIVEAFKFEKDITLNWSESYDLNADWSFSIYLPLPAPVSFLGINFSFDIKFTVHVQLYLKAGLAPTSCSYTFEVGAVASTGLITDAGAAVRAAAVEGGVFISGTLVKLSTDPKLSVTFNLAPVTFTRHIQWYVTINAFEFEWGFFYRYWKLLKWSGKNYIGRWKITNGVSKRYLIFKD